MYLKSLEVHGFKSFANKLLFEFHNGITAIVGPNGSGKSNVADAVRWVLGEQSAKQLRGAKMEDVIFSGTQMRKPLGYAYVAITISNEDHKLDVPYEEVKIARRVYRSGESEYLLNGAPCRLKDVQELLFDTGIGKEGYSIIGQGQIDKILSGKPEERRELFDEAAGIVKYKKRKAAAEKNLEEERQNLVRIEDILSELEKQVEPLQKQSEKAKEYLHYRDELRNLDINVFLMEYDTLRNDLQEIEKKQEIAAHELKQAEADYEKTKEQYLLMEKQLEEKDACLENLKKEAFEKKEKCNQLHGEQRILEEQILSIQRTKETNKDQLQLLKQRITAYQKEQENYLSQKADMQTAIEKLKQEESSISEKVDSITAEISEIERQASQCNKEMLSVLNKNTDVKSEQQRIRTLLEQNNLKRAEIMKRVLENKTAASVLEESYTKGEKQLADFSEKLTEVEQKIESIKANLEQTESLYENMRKEQHDMQQQYHIENSRLVSLKNLTERYEGFGQSIRKVMDQKQHHKGIIGVVADILRVKKEYELAVETALGGSIQNIVTDNEQTAKEMIGYLKKNRYGRATFLPLTNMKAKPVSVSGNIMAEPGVIGMASTLVETEERFTNLVQYLLGRFVVVDHIDHAIALAKKYHHTIRIVTVEGDLLNPGGSMSGGAFRNNNNLLGRRREMEDLEKRTTELKEKLQDIVLCMEKKDREKADITAEYAKLQKESQDIRIQQNSARIHFERAKADLEKNKEQLEFILLEQREIDLSKEALHADIERVNQTMENNESLGKEHQKQLEELNQQIEKKRQSQQDIAKQSAQIMMECTAKEQSMQFVEENIARTNREQERLDEEIKRINDSEKHADEEILEKEQQKQQNEALVKQLEEQMQRQQEKTESEEKEREQLFENHKKFLGKREELSEKKSNLDKECFRLDSQKEKVSERMDYAANYMWEEYELTYHSAEEKRIPTSLNLGELKVSIMKLKNQMKALGNVNVNAIEQYREVQERYELLNAQHDDLIKAAEVIVGIIEELDTEMRRQFEEQFAEIRSRFDHVFRELFGGGRGSLELTKDEDILQAGITIIAQPPGKKLQNMMQLSGGEKALTAIALLFAIQSLKPSPFCLLDEIEAALDDSNVSRFAEYLHKLTKDTQFIVITHRRGTMNSADILYGITMQEKGVSTLVSVNLLDEKEIAN